MGAKLNTASSGWVDMNALAQAVWEYGMRSLTESAWLTTEQATQLTRIDTTVALNLDAKVSEAWWGGWWLTEAQNKHLMKLRNGWGGALINFESIEKWLLKDREWLYKKIEEIPWIVKQSEEKVIESIEVVNNWISYIIENTDLETLSEKIDKLEVKTDESIKLSKEQAQEGRQKVERLSHTIETYRLEDEIKEETKELEQEHENKIEQEVKGLESEIQIQDEVQKLALEAQIQDEIKLLSNI